MDDQNPPHLFFFFLDESNPAHYFITIRLPTHHLRVLFVFSRWQVHFLSSLKAASFLNLLAVQ